MKKLLTTTGITLTAVSALSAQAQNSDDTVKNELIPTAPAIEEIYVTGGKKRIQTVTGSATLIDATDLQKFDAADLNDVLSQAPGVYIRFEDGFGLRPNIGIRGVTSDRSQKITTMEDGILIAPAPYSAPASYYFPNISRMEATEVFKGPAAIKYGPHTVGGALNLVTPPVPEEQGGLLSATVGNYGFQKYRGVYGDNHGDVAYWVDGLHYSASGFKELDGGGDTGFERNDINTKIQWQPSHFDKAQLFEIKLGYAEEDGNETYLGLTDEDFSQNPNRRYRASQNDKITTEHTQVHGRYRIEMSDDWTVSSQVYYNQFDRAWLRLNGFIGPQESDNTLALTGVRDILANPDQYAVEMAILRGEQDSAGPTQTLELVNNDRRYGSYGLNVNSKNAVYVFDTEHTLETGLRFHHDYVERLHTPFGYNMINGNVISDGVTRDPSRDEKAETDAIAAYVRDEWTVSRWTFNAGLRYEMIDGNIEQYTDEGVSDTLEQSVVIPGIGALFQWTDNLAFLVGINKGFSPSAPVVNASDDYEESTNYEYGLRYNTGETRAEVIGFFSDYKNLIGRCRDSDGACAGEEFGAGDVEVSGLEITVGHTWTLDSGLQIPIDFVYTYTESAFQTSFISDFVQWGSVEQGDEMPYLPKHQGRIGIGIEGERWAVASAIKHLGKTRELPGQDGYDTSNTLNSFTRLDLSLRYDVSEQLSLQLIGENITDEKEIAARRPFGARPHQPISLKAGATYRF